MNYPYGNIYSMPYDGNFQTFVYDNFAGNQGRGVNRYYQGSGAYPHFNFPNESSFYQTNGGGLINSNTKVTKSVCRCKHCRDVINHIKTANLWESYVDVQSVSDKPAEEPTKNEIKPEEFGAKAIEHKPQEEGKEQTQAVDVKEKDDPTVPEQVDLKFLARDNFKPQKFGVYSAMQNVYTFNEPSSQNCYAKPGRKWKNRDQFSCLDVIMEDDWVTGYEESIPRIPANRAYHFGSNNKKYGSKSSLNLFANRLKERRKGLNDKWRKYVTISGYSLVNDTDYESNPNLFINQSENDDHIVSYDYKIRPRDSSRLETNKKKSNSDISVATESSFDKGNKDRLVYVMHSDRGTSGGPEQLCRCSLPSQCDCAAVEYSQYEDLSQDRCKEMKSSSDSGALDAQVRKSVNLKPQYHSDSEQCSKSESFDLYAKTSITNIGNIYSVNFDKDGRQPSRKNSGNTKASSKKTSINKKQNEEERTCGEYSCLNRIGRCTRECRNKPKQPIPKPRYYQHPDYICPDCKNSYAMGYGPCAVCYRASKGDDECPDPFEGIDCLDMPKKSKKKGKASVADKRGGKGGRGTKRSQKNQLSTNRAPSRLEERRRDSSKKEQRSRQSGQNDAEACTNCTGLANCPAGRNCPAKASLQYFDENSVLNRSVRRDSSSASQSSPNGKQNRSNDPCASSSSSNEVSFSPSRKSKTNQDDDPNKYGTKVGTRNWTEIICDYPTRCCSCKASLPIMIRGRTDSKPNLKTAEDVFCQRDGCGQVICYCPNWVASRY